MNEKLGNGSEARSDQKQRLCPENRETSVSRSLCIRHTLETYQPVGWETITAPLFDCSDSFYFYKRFQLITLREYKKRVPTGIAVIEQVVPDYSAIPLDEQESCLRKLALSNEQAIRQTGLLLLNEAERLGLTIIPINDLEELAIKDVHFKNGISDQRSWLNRKGWDVFLTREEDVSSEPKYILVVKIKNEDESSQVVSVDLDDLLQKNPTFVQRQLQDFCVAAVVEEVINEVDSSLEMHDLNQLNTLLPDELLQILQAQDQKTMIEETSDINVLLSLARDLGDLDFLKRASTISNSLDPDRVIVFEKNRLQYSLKLCLRHCLECPGSSQAMRDRADSILKIDEKIREDSLPFLPLDPKQEEMITHPYRYTREYCGTEVDNKRQKIQQYQRFLNFMEGISSGLTINDLLSRLDLFLPEAVETFKRFRYWIEEFRLGNINEVIRKTAEEIRRNKNTSLEDVKQIISRILYFNAYIAYLDSPKDEWVNITQEEDVIKDKLLSDLVSFFVINTAGNNSHAQAELQEKYEDKIKDERREIEECEAKQRDFLDFLSQNGITQEEMDELIDLSKDKNKEEGIDEARLSFLFNVLRLARQKIINIQSPIVGSITKRLLAEDSAYSQTWDAFKRIATK